MIPGICPAVRCHTMQRSITTVSFLSVAIARSTPEIAQMTILATVHGYIEFDIEL
jgi:hypothetical protein